MCLQRFRVGTSHFTYMYYSTDIFCAYVCLLIWFCMYIHSFTTNTVQLDITVYKSINTGKVLDHDSLQLAHSFLFLARCTTSFVSLRSRRPVLGDLFLADYKPHTQLTNLCYPVSLVMLLSINLAMHSSLPHILCTYNFSL